VIRYNDEASDGASHSSRGHSKGVLLFEDDAGFWITHSLPKFPTGLSDEKQTFSLPDLTYAQHFFCISLNPTNFESIASQMKVNDPFIYDYNLPESISPSFPQFSSWIDMFLSEPQDSSISNSTHVASITSLGGKRFKSFAKSKAFERDLWSGLVAPSLTTNMIVQTWRNGDGRNIPASCSKDGYKYEIFNMLSISGTPIGCDWKSTKDHSKWSVSADIGFVCFGDINRQYSQYKRGGGALCMKDPVVWQSLHNLVGMTETCR
jgi:deoxyribonuclease-2